jgi:LPXTG-motif cell wall-anchored protein
VRRTSLAVLVAVLMMVLAGCSGFEGLPGDGNGSATPQVTETPTTPESTPESTEAPAETEPPATEAGDGDESAGGSGSSNSLLPWLGLLLVFVLGLAAFGVLRRRNRSDPVSAEAPRGDGEEVISLLHRNNGRVFEDVLEEELDWSPAHTRRVLDGLVATGDVERTQTQRGVLVTFTDPDRRLENESVGGGEDEDDVESGGDDRGHR